MFEFFVLRDFHVMTWTILQTMIGHDIYEFNYFGRFQGFFFVLSINVLDSYYIKLFSGKNLTFPPLCDLEIRKWSRIKGQYISCNIIVHYKVVFFYILSLKLKYWVNVKQLVRKS